MEDRHLCNNAIDGDKIMLRPLLDSFNGLRAACVLSVALLAPVIPLRAATSTPTPPQAFVKVNQFYLLYTYPVVPYLDKSGTLMVGLEGFARCLITKAPASDPQAKFYDGDDYGRVTTDAAARTETLTLGDHVLTFTAGSATVQADGAGVAMEAAAVWNTATRQMVVPAASLARSLGLVAAWNPQKLLLTVTAPDPMTSNDADDMGGADFAVDRTALVPWRVTSRTTDAPADTHYPLGPAAVRLLPHPPPWLLYEVRNVFGAAIQVEELNVLVLYSGAGKSGNLDGIGRVAGNGPSPTIPASGIRRFSVSLQEDPDSHAVPLCVVSYPDMPLPRMLPDPFDPMGTTSSAVGFIDPSITGLERAVVAQAMTNLRPEDRQNVIVVEPNGTVYANRPKLRSLFAPLHWIKGNIYENGQGHPFTLPAPEPKPTATGMGEATTGARPDTTEPAVANPAQPYPGSGPYIRFYTTPPASDSAQGFAYESASVYLPGVTPSAINVCENPIDSAATTLYVGGWSAGASPTALDVGFAHEGASSKHASAGWNDDWYAFWGIGSAGTNPGTGNATSLPWSATESGYAIRFKSNQTATLSFYVSGTGTNTQLDFVWGGICYNFSTYALIPLQKYALVYNTTAGKLAGWSTQGTGMILKSMTSIAQQATQNVKEDDFFDGSFVQGVAWSNFMLCPTGNGIPEQASYYYANGNVQFYPDGIYPDTGIVDITASGCSESLNPFNPWDRTDSIIVP
jgi:hypothetical protein